MKKLTHLLFLLILAGLNSYAQGDQLVSSPDSNTTSIRQITATVKNRNKVVLQWNLDNPAGAGFATIERSRNGVDFESIGVLKTGSNIIRQEFEDEMPSNGINYYRIKFSPTEGRSKISPVVNASVAGDLSCKFYPNPVDKLLIVRSESPVDIQLTDAFGKTRIIQKSSGGLQLVDVSLLEKGLYIITITQKESNKTMTEKLMKN
jgi:hypothetical protein